MPELVDLLPTGTLLSKAIAVTPGGLKATTFVYGVMSRLHDAGSCQYKPGKAKVPPGSAKALPFHTGLLR